MENRNCNQRGFFLSRGVDSFSHFEFEPVDLPVSKVDSILDIIYSVDPVTNLPTGHIGMYLSDKTSDAVRSYIEQNIMFDLGDSTPEGYSDLSKSLSSEFMAEMSRNRFESYEDFEQRVKDFCDKEDSKAKVREYVEKLSKKNDN